MEERFKGFDTARGRTDNYLQEGTHTLVIEALRQQDSFDGKYDVFVAEFTVLESTTMPKGIRASWVVKAMKDPRGQQEKEQRLRNLGDIRQMLAAVTGSSIDEITGAALGQVTGAGNPLQGDKVVAACHKIRTKSGGDFTKIAWAPLAA